MKMWAGLILGRDMKENLFMPLSLLLESSAFLPFLYTTFPLSMSTSVPKCLTLYKWDRLGPGTFHCDDCTWTHLSYDKMQINYMGLKITVHAQLGQILDKRSKETEKPNCHFWRAWSKTGCQEQNWVLGTRQSTEHAPCTCHYLRDGQTT